MNRSCYRIQAAMNNRRRPAGKCCSKILKFKGLYENFFKQVRHKQRRDCDKVFVKIGKI